MTKDPFAPWQHVTLYGLSIGARGTVPFRRGPHSITDGTLNWPNPATGGPEAIDDLWHAAINSRGQFFNPQNAQQLAEDMVSALAVVSDPFGTGAGVGMGGAQLSVTNEYAYKTSYESGLWGDVKKYALDIATGVLPVDATGYPLSAPIWSAATQLDAQAAGTGWDSNRRIVTRNDATNAVVPFRFASLSSAQQSGLNAGWSSVSPQPTGQSVLNYLRGDNSNVGFKTTNFRTRSHILGDIVYSGAVPVGPPNLPYTNSTNPGYESSKTPTRRALQRCTSEQVTAWFTRSTTRRRTAEGRLGPTFPRCYTAVAIPTIRRTRPIPHSSLDLSRYRRGGIPLYSHKFFVNATPRVWDVDFKNTNVSNVTGPRRPETIGGRSSLADWVPAGDRSMRWMSPHPS